MNARVPMLTPGKRERGKLSVKATLQVAGAEQVRISKVWPDNPTERQARGLTTSSFRSESTAACAVVMAATRRVIMEKRMISSYGNSR